MASKRLEREEAQQAEAASEEDLDKTPGRAAAVTDELLEEDTVVTEDELDDLDDLEDEEEAAAEDAETAGL